MAAEEVDGGTAMIEEWSRRSVVQRLLDVKGQCRVQEAKTDAEAEVRRAAGMRGVLCRRRWVGLCRCCVLKVRCSLGDEHGGRGRTRHMTSLGKNASGLAWTDNLADSR